MGKILLIALAVVVLVWLIKRALGGRAAPLPPQAAPKSGALVACAHCGVNLPQVEARSETGPKGVKFYCSEEHLRAGPRGG